MGPVWRKSVRSAKRPCFDVFKPPVARLLLWLIAVCAIVESQTGRPDSLRLGTTPSVPLNAPSYGAAKASYIQRPSHSVCTGTFECCLDFVRQLPILSPEALYCISSSRVGRSGGRTQPPCPPAEGTAAIPYVQAENSDKAARVHSTPPPYWATTNPPSRCLKVVSRPTVPRGFSTTVRSWQRSPGVCFGCQLQAVLVCCSSAVPGSPALSVQGEFPSNVDMVGIQFHTNIY